jgi:isoquinoline 1-oxidoreductase subunit beta
MKFEIHTGNQWQTLILPVLSKTLGLPQEGIVLRSYYLGGGFGRRLNGPGDRQRPYAAVGARLRHLPIRPVAVRDALTRRN